MSRQVLALVTEFRELTPYQKERVIRVCMPMVRRVVLRLARKVGNIDIQDTFNAGLLGLADALDSYSLDHASDFYNFARYRVRDAILQNLRNEAWCSPYLIKQTRKIEKAIDALERKNCEAPGEIEIACEMGITLDVLGGIRARQAAAEVVSLEKLAIEERFGDSAASQADSEPRQSFQSVHAEKDPLGALLASEEKVELARAMARLEGNEQRVIAMYYRKELNLKEIGRVLGVTESRASQIRLQALRRLRHLLSDPE